ncbi:hypothetical protein [Trichormus azollae]|uniref:hypothetical protein n=1 Tax=Trichormus azollae TaxID=1164 RepID=UPI00325D32A6
MQTIAQQYPQIVVNLLSGEIWAQFIRLKIAQPDESPDQFILKQTTHRKQEKTQNKKRDSN